MVRSSARRSSKTSSASLGLALASASAVLVVGAATGILGGGCNQLNGSGDLATSDGPGNLLEPDGGRLPDGAFTGSGEGGTANDGGGGGGDGSTTGGGFIDDAGVDPKVESCGPSLVCLPDVAGWSPATFLFGGAGGPNGICPAEYPQATTLQTSGRGNCACNCVPSGGSCGGGIDSISGVACGGVAMPLKAVAGQCSVVSATLRCRWLLRRRAGAVVAGGSGRAAIDQRPKAVICRRRVGFGGSMRRALERHVRGCI